MIIIQTGVTVTKALSTTIDRKSKHAVVNLNRDIIIKFRPQGPSGTIFLKRCRVEHVLDYGKGESSVGGECPESIHP
jgi:hypothetical protein